MVVVCIEEWLFLGFVECILVFMSLMIFYDVYVVLNIKKGVFFFVLVKKEVIECFSYLKIDR